MWMYRRQIILTFQRYNILPFSTRIWDRFRNENKYYWHGE